MRKGWMNSDGITDQPQPVATLLYLCFLSVGMSLHKQHTNTNTNRTRSFNTTNTTVNQFVHFQFSRYVSIISASPWSWKCSFSRRFLTIPVGEALKCHHEVTLYTLSQDYFIFEPDIFQVNLLWNNYYLCPSFKRPCSLLIQKLENVTVVSIPIVCALGSMQEWQQIWNRIKEQETF